MSPTSDLRTPQLAEQRPNGIWKMLDNAKIPFRECSQVWVDRFGTHIDREYLRCYAENSHMIIEDLAEPFSFHYRHIDSLLSPPDRLVASYQKYDDADTNLASVRRQLERLLGSPSQEFSHNHVGAYWMDGLAMVSIHIHPRELNEPYLSAEPYLSNPHLVSQCHIEITPMWTEDLNVAHYNILQNYEPWLEWPKDSNPFPGSDIYDHKAPDTMLLPAKGFGIANNQYIAIIGHSRIITLIDIKSIIKLQLVGAIKARCSAYSDLKLYYRSPDNKICHNHIVPVFRGNHFYYQDIGRRLAQHLNVEFDECFFPSE